MSVYRKKTYPMNNKKIPVTIPGINTETMKKIETAFIIAGVVTILAIGTAFLVEVAKFNPNIFGI